MADKIRGLTAGTHADKSRSSYLEAFNKMQNAIVNEAKRVAYNDAIAQIVVAFPDAAIILRQRLALVQD